MTDIKFTPLVETLEVKKIDDAEYFSPKYSKYISNSRLGSINPEQGGSPDKFFTPLEGLYTDSVLLGSAVHSMVLQPELFELVDTCRPTAKLGFVCDYLYDHWDENHFYDLLCQASDKINYYKGKITDTIQDKVKEAFYPYKEERDAYVKKPNVEPMFLPHKIYETAQNCINACNENKKFQEIMHPSGILEPVISKNELAFTMDIKCDFPDRLPIIVKLKSKIDNFTINLETNTIVVNDLKTIGSILPDFDGPEGNFGKYHYHRELAIYLWLLKLCVEKEYGMKNPTMFVNCLVVSTIPTYYTKVYKVNKQEIADGFAEFRKCLRLVAYYKAYEGYDFK